MTNIDRIKRGLILIGTIGLVSGAWMSFSFGAAMSLAHGITLALLTCLAAIMFTAIDYLKQSGMAPWKLRTLTGLAIVFLGAELFSHVGYSVGTRVENTEMTAVQNVRYDDSREQVTDNKSNLKMWKERLAKLQAENGWTATVSADALRAKLPGLNLQIEQESARGGCGPKCLAFTKERDEVQSKIGMVEEVSTLTKQIEATQKLVDKYRETAAKVEFKSSPIVNQTKFVSQLATVSLEPGKEALTWAQIGIGLLIALVTTFLPPFAYFLAFGDAIHKAHPTTGFVRGKAPTEPSGPVESRFAPPAQAQSSTHTREMLQPVIVDDSKWAALITNLRANPKTAAMLA